MPTARTLCLVLALLAAVAGCLAAVANIEETSTDGWQRSGVASGHAGDIVSLVIGMRVRQREALEKALLEVSDPRSPLYGKHYSLSAVRARFGAPDSSFRVVENFIRQPTACRNRNSTLRIERLQGGDWLKAKVTPECASALFSGTESATLDQHVFHRFAHTRMPAGSYLVRAPTLPADQQTLKSLLPAAVAAEVDVVLGASDFPRLKRPFKLLRRPNLQPGGLGTITPAVIKQVFGIPSNFVGNNSHNKQAVAQFLGQYFNPADLKTFQEDHNIPLLEPYVDGPNDPSNAGVEATLDIEYITSVAAKVPTWFVSTAGTHEGQEPFLTWILNLSSTPNAPWVHSISYGDVESSIDQTWADRVNIEFQKFGLRGHSILFASGDDGTGCSASGQTFEPNFPGSSPFVTAVGGVSGQQATITGDPISSGGFSNFWKRPDYQESAVTTYLKRVQPMPPSHFFAQKGRGIPDIASFSENVEVTMSGNTFTVGGTSCAAPVISAVISLINDARLNHGKKPLGFLNPFIYSTLDKDSSAFIDITQGNNANGECTPGWSCSAGWDAVTGVGLPNWPKLLEHALAA